MGHPLEEWRRQKPISEKGWPPAIPSPDACENLAMPISGDAQPSEHHEGSSSHFVLDLGGQGPASPPTVELSRHEARKKEPHLTMNDSEDDLANEYRRSTVEEIQNVCSKLDEVDSSLEAIYSRAGDMHSTVRDVELRVGDVQSNLRTLDCTLGDINAKLHESKSKLEAIHSTLGDIKSVLRGRSGYDWLLLLFIIFIIESWQGSKLDRFTDRAWYSMSHNADWSNVDIQRRPSDCDFSHAPLGGKRCSYSKQQMIFDNSERQKLMAQAQTQEEKIEVSKRPNTVTVYWLKKDEP
jgi:archaellum component FlaC